MGQVSEGASHAIPLTIGRVSQVHGKTYNGVGSKCLASTLRSWGLATRQGSSGAHSTLGSRQSSVVGAPRTLPRHGCVSCAAISQSTGNFQV